MRWIWGVVTAAVSVMVQLLILSFLDFNFFSFSLWFVIPVGGIVLGAIATSGYFYKVVRQGLMPSNNNFIASVFIVLLSFIGFMYGEYQMAYVSPSNEINYKFEGEHISNFAFEETDEPITFLKYYDYKLENSGLSIFVKGNVGNAIDVEPNKWVNVIKFVIQGLGLLIGGLFMGLLITSGKTHCTSCKKAYLKEHKLLNVNDEMVNPVVEEINRYIVDNNSEGLVKYIMEQKDNCEIVAYDTKVRYGFSVGHCPNCLHGFMIMKRFERDKDGNYEEQENKKAVIPVNHDIVVSSLKVEKAS